MFHALVLPPQGSQANAIPISICPVLSILTGPTSAQTSNFHRPFVVGRIFRRTCRHRFVRNTLLSTCCVSLAIIRPFNRVPNSVEYYENLTHISKSMLITTIRFASTYKTIQNYKSRHVFVINKKLRNQAFYCWDS